MTVLLIVVSVLLLAALAAGLVVALRPPGWVLRAAGTLYSGVLFEVKTTQNVIALTIDDAPHPAITPEILRLLREHNAKATFFVIGEYAEKYPQLIDMILAGGHELGNHLYTDSKSVNLSPKDFEYELTRTGDFLRAKAPVTWCRPGHGAVNRRIIQQMLEHGYSPCLATAYPLDLLSTVQAASKHFMANVHPGAILVLHDGKAERVQTLKVLERVLPKLAAGRIQVTTVSELVDRAG